MICQWKRISATEWVARWQEQRLTLRYETAVGWRLHIDERGARTVVKKAWPSLSAAKAAIDTKQNKIILALMAQRATEPYATYVGGARA